MKRRAVVLNGAFDPLTFEEAVDAIVESLHRGIAAGCAR
jgi:hypothetical protein